ncbi:MAG TPA: DUF58 domain-containing protein [Acidimicrobiales bacterium]|nr:DUF58 domain-containing protein [Acidimicrobiales bacterium]
MSATTTLAAPPPPPTRRRLPTGLRPRKRVHPLSWYGPVVGSFITVVALSSVAHSSGSGWVQSVGALVAAVLATGLVAPLFSARRARVTCIDSPSDTVAGRTISLTMSANGPHRIQPLLPLGPEVRAAGRVRGRRRVTVEVVPDRRGVIRSVILEVASSSPFGMLWWATEVVVPLSRPLHVAPRMGSAGKADETSDDRSGSATRRISSITGEARGIRQYQPGDLKRTVHWPATSHTGTLMVSETERATDSPVVVEVSLPADVQGAEREAERVMAVVSGYLSRGIPVTVSSLEAGGPTVRLVLDRIELGRRLARAVPPP